MALHFPTQRPLFPIPPSRRRDECGNGNDPNQDYRCEFHG
jgi:hypothetical protein